MTDAQKRLRELLARQSQERGRMAELAAVDELTDETRSELDALEKGTPDLERQLRAVRVVVDADGAGDVRQVGADDDAEAREVRELRGRVRMGGYLSAALEQRAANGVEAEFNAAIGIAGNRVPIELLAPAETRQATGVDTATAPRRWVDRLFAGTAAERVGVSMESVPAGVASHPITLTGPAAAQRAKSEAAADAMWTIGVTELKPKRNAVRLVFNTEDAARIPGLEAALSRDLRMALTEGIDRAIFVGDAGATGTDADITGLQTATGLTEKTIAQSAKVKGSDVLKVFAELVDGKHATEPGQLRTVLSVPANTLWAHTEARTAASVDTTIAEYLRRWGLSWMAREALSDATTNNKFAGYVGLGRGIEGAGVAAIWSAGELIRDPYSGAASGEVALTLSYLWNFGLVRASNFARLKFVT